jgi:hypothetical protein
MIAHLPRNKSVRLLSQAGQNVTTQHPELQTPAGLLPADHDGWKSLPSASTGEREAMPHCSYL